MMRMRWLPLAVVGLAACRAEPDPSLARMLSQRRGDPFEDTPVFADGKVMQAPPPNTIPRDDDSDDPPPPVTRELIALGRAHYDVVCANCHGVAGDGVSFVAQKMTLRKPPSFLDIPEGHDRGRLFEVATNGYGLMPALGPLLSRRERWAVASYVQVLASRRVRVAELTADQRAQLARSQP